MNVFLLAKLDVPLCCSSQVHFEDCKHYDLLTKNHRITGDLLTYIYKNHRVSMFTNTLIVVVIVVRSCITGEVNCSRLYYQFCREDCFQK